MGADLAQEVLAVAGLAHDVEAGIVEQAHRTLAQQHRVVGDHDAHGISARSDRALAGRAVDVEAAVERGHAVGEAAQAGAAGGVGAATAVVAHLDDQAAVVVRELDLDLRRVRVAGHVGQGLGDGEVGGDLDGGRVPRGGGDSQHRRQRRPGHERAQRRLQAALGQDRGVDAARELTELPGRGGELVRGLLEQARGLVGRAVHARPRQAQIERQPDQPLLGPVVQVALEPAARLVRGLHHARPRGAQLGLLVLALGDVPDVAGEAGRAGQVDAGDGQLERELGPVGAHPCELHAAVEHRPVPGGEEAGQPGAVALAQRRRHDQVGHVLADDGAGLVPEGALGGRVEVEDAAAVIDGDHCVERGRKHGPVAALADVRGLLGPPALDREPHLVAQPGQRAEKLHVGLARGRVEQLHHRDHAAHAARREAQGGTQADGLGHLRAGEVQVAG